MKATPGDVDRGYLVAVASAAVLSTTAILIRHLTVTFHLPPLVLAFWRNAFVVVTLVVALGLLRPALLRVPRRHLLHLAGHGLLLAVFNALWTFSVGECGAALATVLVYTSGASTALLGAWFLSERLTRTKLAAIALCGAGSVLVSGAAVAGGPGANVAGVVAGILSGACYAGYTVLGRSAARRGLDPWTTLLYTFGFGAVALLLPVAGGALRPGAAGRSDLLWLGDAVDGWGTLFLLAAGPTVVGFGLYNVSLRYLPSSVANLIVALEPAFTAAIAYVALGERLGGAELAGSLVIAAAVLLLRLGERPRAGAGLTGPAPTSRTGPPPRGPPTGKQRHPGSDPRSRTPLPAAAGS